MFTTHAPAPIDRKPSHHGTCGRPNAPRNRSMSKLWSNALFLASAFVVSALTSTAAIGAVGDVRTHKSQNGLFQVRIIAEGLKHPWSVALLPSGDFLVTERPGSLLRVSKSGQKRRLNGLPPIVAQGQGGLLDVVLHPNFASNRRIYISYAGVGPGGTGTDVAHAVLGDTELEDVTVIFRALPKTSSGHHFGSRLLFGPSGHLFITLGDRGERSRAQDLDDHAGSIIRLHDDGKVPADNPFLPNGNRTTNARPEIYSYGHRNVQGVTLDPKTGTIWATEHGPQGGDELNTIARGANYGWPEITYGRNYFSGTRIGEGVTREDVNPPAHQWTPSIAPSGLAFYSGRAFPAWQGNVFAGALKFQLIARLTVDNGRIVSEERLLEGEYGRIRDVRQGPDGFVYFLTDARNGVLARIEPTP